ncbi:thiopurine S-methyltransferase-like [Patiria miniata]|uniref:thiopurine S-methyltransferase n=1 Tax=Patiria miniata TaxID=46514 RepID=A0A914A0E2_PATMI|nr:thiopurine S-methyltransferase-like [Patiria miniata]
MTEVDNDEFWRQMWVDDEIGFHKSEVHPILVKYIAELTAGQGKCRIFVPLCGKSKDMKWLADQGHTVVGAELSALAIQDFFKENKVEFTSSPMEGVSDADLYKSKDDSIHLYKANIFDLKRDTIGEFDCIWDRASLVALLREDLQKYADQMRSLLKPKGRCLLEHFDYDQSKMNGPPFSTPASVVEKLYAEGWEIKALQVTDDGGLKEAFRSKGHEYFKVQITLLTKE